MKTQNLHKEIYIQKWIINVRKDVKENAKEFSF